MATSSILHSDFYRASVTGICDACVRFSIQRRWGMLTPTHNRRGVSQDLATLALITDAFMRKPMNSHRTVTGHWSPALSTEASAT